MKLKKLVKKGGVADIVTLIIIVGLVIALIVAFVVPWMNKTNESGRETTGNVNSVFQSVSGMDANS